MFARTLYHTDKEDVNTCVKISRLFYDMRKKYAALCAYEDQYFPYPQNAEDLHATFDRFMSSLHALETFVYQWYEEEEEEDEDEDEDE